MKKLTVGDGYAVMILAGQRMGFESVHVEDSKRQLGGEAIHPMTGAAMEAAAIRVNDRVRHDEALIAKANVHCELIKAEYGFTAEISREAFVSLQEEAESLELAHAMGQEQPHHEARLKVIDQLMSAGGWTMHPDYGCVPKSEINAIDRVAKQVG